MKPITMSLRNVLDVEAARAQREASGVAELSDDELCRVLRGRGKDGKALRILAGDEARERLAADLVGELGGDPHLGGRLVEVRNGTRKVKVWMTAGQRAQLAASLDPRAERDGRSGQDAARGAAGTSSALARYRAGSRPVTNIF